MDRSILDELMETVRSGKKIEFEVVSKKPDLHKASIRYTRLGRSGEGMLDADYTFDFSELSWEKDLHNFSGVERGTIPADAAERFLQEISFIQELEPAVYSTGTERSVPATEEERYTLGLEMLRRTGCELVIPSLYYRFRWVAEADTADPYGRLYRALENLRGDCGL